MRSAAGNAPPFLNHSRFRLPVLDLQGQLITVDIEAMDVQEAHVLAARRGLTPVQSASPSRRLGLQRSRPFDSIAFAQDMATLLAAGVTVRESVRALAQRERVPVLRHMLSRISVSVAEGNPLSTALRQTGVVPDLMIATVLASEQTGDLAVGMVRYAGHQASLRTVRDRVVSACVYPMLLLAVSLMAIIILLGVVVPRFAVLIDIEGRQLPFMSRVLMQWGRFASENPWIAASAFAVVVLVVTWLLVQLRTPSIRRLVLEKIPGFAALGREFQQLQLYRTTAILTSRGVPLHKALAHGRDLLGPTDQLRLDEALARMKDGAGIAASLSAAGLSDQVATSMLAVAESTGAISEMLDRIADFYDRKLQKNIDLASRLAEPALMILFGLLIGAIVVLMYLPIFDLASTVG
jgi:general secretion pathway protein F